MQFTLKRAGTIAATMTFLATLLGAQGSGAVAQDRPLQALLTEPVHQTVSQPVVQPLPDAAQGQAGVANSATDGSAVADSADAPAATTLAALVAAQPQPETLSPNLRCLAGAIYFEAKSESLAGRLAVGRVIVDRARSGRFPASYCGVVYQPSQFSFIHGHAIPAVNTDSRSWREAVAIAEIADANSWRSPAEGALFFHAAHVSPGWRLTRVAQIDHHVFYR
jgi:spore germination cell wall hydrolase CwlJ-like protein